MFVKVKEMIWIFLDLKLQDWKETKLQSLSISSLLPCSFCRMLVSAVSCCEQVSLRGRWC